MRRDIVVVGASAGGIEALQALVASLPAAFPASLFAVLHMGPDSPGVLASILDRAGPLPAIPVDRRERIRPATVYVPAPDCHMIVEPGFVRATRGPKENRFRPAIDPLFRSAAQTFGPRTIGVILTGGLDDGTAGLWAVKQLGGVAIVQDPDDAIVDSMPRSALNHVRVDHCVPLAQIGPLLIRLTAGTLEAQGGYVVPEPIRIEIDIASDRPATEAGVMELGRPSNYACPECHGVLLKLDEDGRIRFRCHTGHAYSAESLLDELDEAIETTLWTALRSLEEKRMLIEHLVGHARERRDDAAAESLVRRARAMHQRTRSLRDALAPADDAA